MAEANWQYLDRSIMRAELQEQANREALEAAEGEEQEEQEENMDSTRTERLDEKSEDNIFTTE